jgi:hypothetical protein
MAAAASPPQATKAVLPSSVDADRALEVLKKFRREGEWCMLCLLMKKSAQGFVHVSS